MNFYIKVENGQAVEHPAFSHNLIESFGHIPPNWEPFVRKDSNEKIGVYQKFEIQQESLYEKVDGVWTDSWKIRDLTEEEKLAKQEQKKQEWAQVGSNWSTWVFNEELCEFEAPVPKPVLEDGKLVRWCGAENNWKETPEYPKDGKQYRFNFIDWVWNEVTETQ